LTEIYLALRTRNSSTQLFRDFLDAKDEPVRCGSLCAVEPPSITAIVAGVYSPGRYYSFAAIAGISLLALLALINDRSMLSRRLLAKRFHNRFAATSNVSAQGKLRNRCNLAKFTL
jgi:hypothetical protein